MVHSPARLETTTYTIVQGLSPMTTLHNCINRTIATKCLRMPSTGKLCYFKYSIENNTDQYKITKNKVSRYSNLKASCHVPYTNLQDTQTIVLKASPRRPGAPPSPCRMGA
jgi:hypothetical protein